MFYWTYYLCSYFLDDRDYCVVVQLLLKLSVHHEKDLLQFWKCDTDLPRDKREPISAVTLAVILGLGAAGTGMGITSLVTSQQQYTQLHPAVDRDIQELQRGLKFLKDSLVSLSEVVLQNRRGLDLVFLKEGGLCAALKEECCFYVNESGIVETRIQQLHKLKLELQRKQFSATADNRWKSSMFTLLMPLPGLLISILLLVTWGLLFLTELLVL